MPARSHVDLCLFVQILEVEEDRIWPELREVLLSRDRTKIQEFAQTFTGDARDMFVSHETNLHESIHLVQAVLYPFLRWNSIIMFQTVMDMFKDLDALLQLKKTDGISSAIAPAFHVLELDHFIWDLSKKSFFRKVAPVLGVSLTDKLPSEKHAIPLIRLNSLDLVENAASLIQYKISSGNDFPTWKDFHRWSKRNPSYTGIIEFVASYVGDHDLALRIFCPLVQVAFETNRPVQAFAILLGAFDYNHRLGNLKDFLAQSGLLRWLELFDHYLDKAPLEQADYGDPLSKKFFRLDRYSTSNLRYGGMLGHPIIGTFTKRWGELEKEGIGYRYAFCAPNLYSKFVNAISDLFSAPIALLKFTVNGENTVLVTGDLQSTSIATFDARLTERDVRASFVDFLAIYGVVRRLLNALMDNDFRLCHHKDCPSYAANLCNTWIFIPKHHEECTFNDRLAYIRESYGSRSPSRRIKLIID